MLGKRRDQGKRTLFPELVRRNLPGFAELCYLLLEVKKEVYGLFSPLDGSLAIPIIVKKSRSNKFTK